MKRTLFSLVLATVCLAAAAAPPPTLGAQTSASPPTTRDSAHTRVQLVPLDSIERFVVPVTNQYCATKGASQRMRTACAILTRQLASAWTAESLFIASTATDPVIVATIPPAPSTDTGYAVFAASDFESGTIAPFFDPWGTSYPADYLAVVPDPTNSGHGKVLKIRYTNDPANNWFDNNHGIALDPVNHPERQITYGDDVVFTGDLYLEKGPTDSLVNADALRKLNYWCANDTDWSVSSSTPQNHFCFVLSTQPNGKGTVGTSEQLQWNLSLAATQPGSQKTLPLQYAYTNTFVSANAWHRLRIEIKLNSSPIVQDGVLRIALDGAPVVDRSDIWYVDPSWGATQKLHAYDWRIGYQLNSSSKVDETRYWDNVRFAVKRATR
jgi:hypothetical protein